VQPTVENGKKVVSAIAESWGMKPDIEPAVFIRRDKIIQNWF
jgi:hypothetical protein